MLTPQVLRKDLYSEPSSFNSEDINIPYMGDAVLVDKGLLCTGGLIGCISLAGCLLLEDGQTVSFMTHRSSADSEDNLLRFNRCLARAKSVGNVIEMKLFIFHLDFSEWSSLNKYKLPYRTEFVCPTELIANLKIHISSSRFETVIVPYTNNQADKRTGSAFIDSNNLCYGTNMVKGHIFNYPSKTLTSGVALFTEAKNDTDSQDEATQKSSKNNDCYIL